MSAALHNAHAARELPAVTFDQSIFHSVVLRYIRIGIGRRGLLSEANAHATDVIERAVLDDVVSCCL